MASDFFNAEELWEEILSEEPDRIRAAFRNLLLDDEERQSVLAHLQRMTTEEGYIEVQRQSAQAALDALAEFRS